MSTRDPLHTYRAPDDLYTDAMAAAQNQGTNLNEVIRKALHQVVAKDRARLRQQDREAQR